LISVAVTPGVLGAAGLPSAGAVIGVPSVEAPSFFLLQALAEAPAEASAASARSFATEA
jgi:hypothetical protein